MNLEIMFSAAMGLQVLSTIALIVQLLANKELRKKAKEQDVLFDKQTENFLELSQRTANIIGQMQRVNDASASIIQMQAKAIETLSAEREREYKEQKEAFKMYAENVRKSRQPRSPFK